MGAFAPGSLTGRPKRRPHGVLRLVRNGLIAGAALQLFVLGAQLWHVYGLSDRVGRWIPTRGPARPTPPPPAMPPPPDLAARALTLPVQGIGPGALRDSFLEPRSGGRTHLGIDILAPRNTPVLAVEAGTIAGIMRSGNGGLTVYQYDGERRYSYYYAHLERYADGLVSGLPVSRGQVIGYVGTSGNAPENVPHLHFSIHRLTDPARWWQGPPVNPYPVLRLAATDVASR